MKKSLFLFLLFSLLYSFDSEAQLDITRNQEFRVSPFGTTFSAPFIDERLKSYGEYTNLSLTYLRRYKSSDYFIKTALSGVTRGAEQISKNEIIGDVFSTTINLFLGAEKQYQYKHFGAFFGAGIIGGFLDYQADYEFPDEVPVRDFTSLDKYVGLSGQLTLFSNITDRLYIYSTFSLSTLYVSRKVSDSNILEDYRGLDTQMLIDGVGIAYKF